MADIDEFVSVVQVDGMFTADDVEEVEVEMFATSGEVEVTTSATGMEQVD
jgi:hypothetical protein